MIQKAIAAVFLALLISGPLCIERFSARRIEGPLFKKSSPMTEEAMRALSQPYRYLSRGKQTFAFLSEDQKYVVKFFNQGYHRFPLWSHWSKKVRCKRRERSRYYLTSYPLAFQRFQEETALIYLHLGAEKARLPLLDVTDWLGLPCRIDLNRVPFVLQKRAEPLFSYLGKLEEDELEEAVLQFAELVASRIEKGISDADHEVEGNFGWLKGRPVQIDPGRFYLEEKLAEEKRVKYEWWSATHRFQKWLEENRPGLSTLFEREIKTSQRKALQRSRVCPAPRKDDPPPRQSPASSDISSERAPLCSSR